MIQLKNGDWIEIVGIVGVKAYKNPYYNPDKEGSSPFLVEVQRWLGNVPCFHMIKFDDMVSAEDYRNHLALSFNMAKAIKKGPEYVGPGVEVNYNADGTVGVFVKPEAETKAKVFAEDQPGTLAAIVRDFKNRQNATDSSPEPKPGRSRIERDERDRPLGGPDGRLPNRIFQRIHEDIGAASMCWTNPAGAGVFDTERASALAFNLCHFIADELDVKTEQDLPGPDCEPVVNLEHESPRGLDTVKEKPGYRYGGLL